MAASTVSTTALGRAVTKVKRHGLKYSMVSVVNVIIGQGLLFVFHALVGIGATVANVMAVCLSAVPAYYLNRAWVWGKRGRSSLSREVLPFWGFAVAGLLLSTLAVWASTRALGIEVTDTGWRQLVPNLANIAAFGSLWVIKFFVLDSYMFGRGHHHPTVWDDDDDEVIIGAVTEAAQLAASKEHLAGSAIDGVPLDGGFGTGEVSPSPGERPPAGEPSSDGR